MSWVGIICATATVQGEREGGVWDDVVDVVPSLLVPIILGSILVSVSNEQDDDAAAAKFETR